MARRPSLSEAELPAVPAFAPAPAKRQEAVRTPARQGKRGVAFWLSPEAFKQLRGMTFEEERSVQSLMEEATDMLFQSRGKHRLARNVPAPGPARPTLRAEIADGGLREERDALASQLNQVKSYAPKILDEARECTDKN